MVQWVSNSSFSKCWWLCFVEYDHAGQRVLTAFVFRFAHSFWEIGHCGWTLQRAEGKNEEPVALASEKMTEVPAPDLDFLGSDCLFLCGALRS